MSERPTEPSAAMPPAQPSSREPAAADATSDQMLLLGARLRDEGALAMLYDRYGRLLYTLARRIVGERDLAEEVVLDVFLRCWHGLEQYDASQGTLATWLLGITRGRAIDLLRGRQPKGRAGEHASSPKLEEQEPGVPTPVDEAALRADVSEALADLSESQRAAIELVYYGGLTQKEVADWTGEPLGAVKIHMRDGFRRLRRVLAPVVDVSAARGGRASVSDIRDQFRDMPDDDDDSPTVQLEVQTPHDALAAYALGALSIDEQRLFELHMFVCTACRTDLAAYQRTANLLPHALPPEQPPVGARERLLARARGEASESLTVAPPLLGVDEAPPVIQAARAPEQVPSTVETVVVQDASTDEPVTINTRRVEPRRGVRIKLASIGWAAALLFVIVSGLLVYVWSATGPHVSLELQILARLPGGQVLTLRGTAVPSASARVFVAENGRRAELAVDTLPPLPAGRVYQLWFDEPGQPSRTGGAFGVDQHGDAVVRVVIPTPLERVRAVGITQEPAPGLASPTGVRLLDWTP